MPDDFERLVNATASAESRALYDMVEELREQLAATQRECDMQAIARHSAELLAESAMRGRKTQRERAENAEERASMFSRAVTDAKAQLGEAREMIRESSDAMQAVYDLEPRHMLMRPNDYTHTVDKVLSPALARARAFLAREGTPQP